MFLKLNTVKSALAFFLLSFYFTLSIFFDSYNFLFLRIFFLIALFLCILELFSIFDQKCLIIWKKLTIYFFFISFILEYSLQFFFSISPYTSLIFLFICAYFYLSIIIFLESIQNDFFYSINILSSHILIIFYLYLPFTILFVLIQQNIAYLVFISSINIIASFSSIFFEKNLKKLRVDFNFPIKDKVLENIFITISSIFFAYVLLLIFPNYFTEKINPIFSAYFTIFIVLILSLFRILGHTFEDILKRSVQIKHSNIQIFGGILGYFSSFLMNVPIFFLIKEMLAILFDYHAI